MNVELRKYIKPHVRTGWYDEFGTYERVRKVSLMHNVRGDHNKNVSIYRETARASTTRTQLKVEKLQLEGAISGHQEKPKM